MLINTMLNPSIYPPAKIDIITSQITWNAVFVAVALALSLFIWQKRPKIFPYFILLFLIIDLFLFATGNLITAPKTLFEQQTSFNPGIDRYLSTADTQDYTGLHVYWNHLRVRKPFAPDLSDQELLTYKRLQKEINLYPGNLNVARRWFTSSGYAAVVLQSYANYLESTEINSVSFKNLEDPRLDVLGINYIITGYPQDYLQDSPDHILISQDPQIYQTKKSNSRIKFVSGEGSAHIATYLPNRIDISTQNSIPDTLVLSDSIYPGWKATIDGQPTLIHPYQDAFRSVDVPSGSHTVTFSYSPASVKIGGIISLITLLLLMIYVLSPINEGHISNQTHNR